MISCKTTRRSRTRKMRMVETGEKSMSVMTSTETVEMMMSMRTSTRMEKTVERSMETGWKAPRRSRDRTRCRIKSSMAKLLQITLSGVRGSG